MTEHTDTEARRRVAKRIAALAWDQGVDAAFRGAVTRQNAADVKRHNPYRAALAVSDPTQPGVDAELMRLREVERRYIAEGLVKGPDGRDT